MMEEFTEVYVMIKLTHACMVVPHCVNKLRRLPYKSVLSIGHFPTFCTQ